MEAFSLRMFSFFLCLLLDGILAQTNLNVLGPLSLHPVQPNDQARRGTAKSEPRYELALHYAPLGYYQHRSHFEAVVKWHFRHEAIVVRDNPTIESFHCNPDGIIVNFDSIEARQRAEKWELPLILITEGSEGSCSYDKEGEEQYHPLMITSLSRSASNFPRTMKYSGYRSRWDLVAFDHQVRIEHATQPQVNRPSLVPRNLRNPPEFDFSPKINYDPINNNASRAEIPKSLWESENASVEMTCNDCYFYSEIHLAIETGSRITNVAVNSLVKIVTKLSDAENALRASLRSAAISFKENLLRWFTNLARELSDTFAEFTQKLSQLKSNPPSDPFERDALEKSVRQSAALTKKKASNFLQAMRSQLDRTRNSELSREEQSEILSFVNETVRTTEDETDLAIETISSEAVFEAEVCSEAFNSQQQGLERRSLVSVQEVKTKRFAFCKLHRRRISAKITGSMKANVDFTLSMKGRMAIGTGPITLLSAGLQGLSIPNIITIGPEARFVTEAEIAFEGTAAARFGADLEWQSLDAKIDGKADQRLSHMVPTKPLLNVHKPSFEFEPAEITISQHFKPQLNFGIILNVVGQEASIGFGADLGYENTFTFGNSATHQADSCRDGLKYQFKLKADLEALVTLPSKRNLVFPNIPEGLFPSKTVFPLLVMEPYTFIEHCFQLPSACRFSKTNSSQSTASSCPRRITSDEL